MLSFNQSCFTSFGVTSSDGTLGKNSSLGGGTCGCSIPGIIPGQVGASWDSGKYFSPFQIRNSANSSSGIPCEVRSCWSGSPQELFSKPCCGVSAHICVWLHLPALSSFGIFICALRCREKNILGPGGNVWKFLGQFCVELRNLCTGASPSSHLCKSLISPLIEFSSCNFIIFKQAKADFFHYLKSMILFEIVINSNDTLKCLFLVLFNPWSSINAQFLMNLTVNWLLCSVCFSSGEQTWTLSRVWSLKSRESESSDSFRLSVLGLLRSR